MVDYTSKNPRSVIIVYYTATLCKMIPHYIRTVI